MNISIFVKFTKNVVVKFSKKCRKIYKNVEKFTKNVVKFTKNVVKFTKNVVKFTKNVVKFTKNVVKFTKNVVKITKNVVKFTKTRYVALHKHCCKIYLCLPTPKRLTHHRDNINLPFHSIHSSQPVYTSFLLYVPFIPHGALSLFTAACKRMPHVCKHIQSLA
jgi:hypothetical protein